MINSCELLNDVWKRWKNEIFVTCEGVKTDREKQLVNLVSSVGENSYVHGNYVYMMLYNFSGTFSSSPVRKRVLSYGILLQGF